MRVETEGGKGEIIRAIHRSVGSKSRSIFGYHALKDWRTVYFIRTLQATSKHRR